MACTEFNDLVITTCMNRWASEGCSALLSAQPSDGLACLGQPNDLGWPPLGRYLCTSPAAPRYGDLCRTLGFATAAPRATGPQAPMPTGPSAGAQAGVLVAVAGVSAAGAYTLGKRRGGRARGADDEENVKVTPATDGEPPHGNPPQPIEIPVDLAMSLITSQISQNADQRDSVASDLGASDLGASVVIVPGDVPADQHRAGLTGAGVVEAGASAVGAGANALRDAAVAATGTMYDNLPSGNAVGQFAGNAAVGAGKAAVGIVQGAGEAVHAQMPSGIDIGRAGAGVVLRVGHAVGQAMYVRLPATSEVLAQLGQVGVEYRAPEP